MKTILFLTSKIVLVLLLFSTGNSFAQSNKDTIYWSANRKLKWGDFKGWPDKTVKPLAMTHAGIGYEVGCNDGELVLKVFCYFNVKASWAKETDSQELLNHEQLHFDITELYTRKLRKKISEVADPCGKNFKELNKVYQTNFNECAKVQDAYDAETEHSLNKVKQKEWEEKIKAELKLLEKFAS